MIKNKFLTILIFFGVTLVFLVSADPVYAGVDNLLRGRVFKESVAISCSRPEATQYNDLYFLGTTCAPGTPGTSPNCNGGPDYTITWSQPSNGWSGSLGPNECDNSMGPNTYAPSYFSGTAGQQQEGNLTGVSTNITVISDSKYKITDWGFGLTDESGYFCHKDGDVTKPLQVDTGAFAIPNQTQSITLPFYIYDETDGSGVIHNCYKNHVTFASKTDPRGNLDSATCSLATGWACDPDNFTQAINVELYTISGGNEVSLGSTTANGNGATQARRDAVAGMCGGNSVHEFSFNIPNTSLDGTVNLKDGASHEIHAKGIDINAPPDGNKELTGSPRSITCSAPPTPNLGALKINANTTDPAGAAKGTADGATYGITGLRADDPNLLAGTSGSNFFNSLTINQQTSSTANSSNTRLVGVAFTGSGSNAPANGSNLQTLMDNVKLYINKGFIMIYAVNDTNYLNGPPVGSCGKNFCSGLFYVYFNGSWTSTGHTPTPNGADAYVSPELKINMKSTASLPTGPTFDTTFYKPLGTRTWGTYGYLMDSNNVEKSAALDPNP